MTSEAARTIRWRRFRLRQATRAWASQSCDMCSQKQWSWRQQFDTNHNLGEAHIHAGNVGKAIVLEGAAHQSGLL
jgi:hypothetical protein